MLMFDEESLHIFNSFIIEIISLVFVIYVNHPFPRLLFDLFLYVILLLVLLYIHLLPPLLLCSSNSHCLTFQTILLSPSPSPCTCFHAQRFVYYPSPPTYPPLPIPPPPEDCPKSSYLMSPLDLLSKTASSSS